MILQNAILRSAMNHRRNFAPMTYRAMHIRKDGFTLLAWNSRQARYTGA